MKVQISDRIREEAKRLFAEKPSAEDFVRRVAAIWQENPGTESMSLVMAYYGVGLSMTDLIRAARSIREEDAVRPFISHLNETLMVPTGTPKELQAARTLLSTSLIGYHLAKELNPAFDLESNVGNAIADFKGRIRRDPTDDDLI